MQNKMKGKIFNAQEVQAMLNESKVMFREVIKNNILKSGYKAGSHDSFTGKSESEMMPCNHAWPAKRIGAICSDCWKELIAKCPYRVGQKIFCKESFCKSVYGEAIYKDEDDGILKVKWKPAQHMKQEHSRLTLLIKEIRVERLGEISEEDAIAEGVFKSKDYWHSTLHPTKGTYQCWTSAKEAFGKLWNATHKKPEEKFEASPFVWCVSFEVINN